MLPKIWEPVAAKNLQRMGPDEDGGYVVSTSAVKHSDVLLSMGLNHDWRFEEAFQKASGAQVICYDGSVDRRFWQLYAVKKVLRLKPLQALHYWKYRKFFGSERAEHRQLMVGYDGPGSIALSTILAEISSNAVFLKIDIEGWEYRILDHIVENRDRFSGIVMELHDIDLHRDRVSGFIQRMDGFATVYLTPNNFAGIDLQGDPIVIEISLMRDIYVDRSAEESESQNIPHIRNTVDRPPINIQFQD